MADTDVTARSIVVSGHVQGVGFRWWCTAQARELDLAGHARNQADGTVEILVQGSAQALDTLLDRLRQEPSTYGRPGQVMSVQVADATPQPDVSGFTER